MIEDPRFKTNQARVENRDLLIIKISALTADQPTHHWLNVLGKAGIPCGPINTINKVFDEPQVQHRGMQVELTRKDGNRLPSVANPINLSQTPVSYRSAPPKLGEHSRDILRADLGLSEEQIEALIEQQIIAAG